VVRLDGGARALNRHGFNNIRVQSALHQITDFAVGFALLQLLRFFGEDGDEFPANDFSLLLRIADAF